MSAMATYTILLDPNPDGGYTVTVPAVRTGASGRDQAFSSRAREWLSVIFGEGLSQRADEPLTATLAESCHSWHLRSRTMDPF
jgi:hypothetical protein